MKKLIILLLILVEVGCVVAYFLPGLYSSEVPDWRQKQYKSEIERVLPILIENARAEGDASVKDAEKYKNEIIKKKLTYADIDNTKCDNLSLTADFLMSLYLLKPYGEIVHISEKYFRVNKGVLRTDWYGTPADYIEPYLDKAGVNYSALKELETYAEQQTKKVEKMVAETAIYCSAH